MSKPSVFIGSSAESLLIAQTIQSLLEYDVHPTVWHQNVFSPSHFPMEALEFALDKSDFAIFVCTPEDLTTIRDKQHAAVRDNVIFEIGFAIGRLGRKRTFLVGPRQGDLHLPTDLNGIAPETFDPQRSGDEAAALGPACNKIRKAILEQGPRQRAESVEDGTRPKVSEANSRRLATSPSADWDFEAYRFEHVSSLIRDDDLAAEAIEKAFRSSALADNERTIAEWEASCEISRLRTNHNGSLARIRALAAQFPDSPALSYSLGLALEHYSDTEGALAAYLHATEVSQNMSLTALASSRAIRLEANLSLPSSAQLLRQRLQSLSQGTHDDRCSYVSGMQSISEAAQVEELAKAIKEVELTLVPDNDWSRFEIARMYAEDNQQKLSLLHYQSIPMRERSGTVWNNLGVNYANLDMPGKAVHAYEQSVDMGETIAEGNLARKLLIGGFYDEAKKRVERAISSAGHHESLPDVLKDIHDAVAEEEKKLSSVVAEAREKQRLRISLGKAALAPLGPDIEGCWETPYGVVKLEADGTGGYSGIGELAREVRNSGLAGLFVAGRTRVERAAVVIRLIRFGNALEGEVKPKVGEVTSTILGVLEQKKKIILMISDDGSELIGLEIGYSENEQRWKRCNETNDVAPGAQQSR